MTGSDGALGRLLAQVGAGIDCVVEGPPPSSRRLFARAAAALAARAEVITVVSPLGELGLSALIAQVSGRPDFDEQDDAVLELGFKRLTMSGRPTVLMLDVPHGVALPALRYLQHVGRSAAGLVMVVLGSPALDAVLEQPGAAAMRSRLRAGSPVSAEDDAELPPPPLAPLVALPGPIRLSSPVVRRARLVPRVTAWAAVAVSVAAASVIVVQLSQVPEVEAPISVGLAQTTSIIAPPTPAVETPVDVKPPVLPPITFPLPALAVPPAVTPPLPALVKPDRVLHARRADPKPRNVVRAVRPTPGWRPDDQTQYSWGGVPPWRRRMPRWNEPGQDGYVVDPYGTPLYPFTR